MRRLAHLSDLHYGADPETQSKLLEGLIETFTGREIDVLLFTGDVFDTNEARPGLIEGFLRLHAGLEAKLGGPKPTIILPGNHDRRSEGVFRPYSEELFDELRRAFASRPEVQVMGGHTPFLAQHVKLTDFPFDVVAYDSTWLPNGVASAGGVIRQEDLIQIGSELMNGDATRPVLFLLHHHLIPTPVTDTSAIATAGRPPWQKFLVRQVLPWLISNGDREELTMTALGAGSALSTLQTLGRAVFVLHGHKHYATARLLKGIDSDADLLISSAGSCGLPQEWIEGDYEEAPKLWPSVNFLELDASEVHVTSQAWSPWNPTRRSSARRLVRARREGTRWVLADTLAPRTFSPVLKLNASKVVLSPCSAKLGRLDVTTERTLESTDHAVLEEYWEVVTGPEGAMLRDAVMGGVARRDAKCPAKIKVPRDGTTRFRVEGGAYRTVTDSDGRAFASVELLNRSRAELARLEVHLGPVTTKPFASVTNLTTGKERPWRFEHVGDVVTVTFPNCPARTMLRVSWPLER